MGLKYTPLKLTEGYLLETNLVEKYKFNIKIC